MLFGGARMLAWMEKGDFLLSLQAFYDIQEKCETSHTYIQEKHETSHTSSAMYSAHML